MAKTLIDIDAEVLSRAMELSGISTKRGTVNEALAQMVRRLELDELTQLAASGGLADLLNDGVMRGAER